MINMGDIRRRAGFFFIILQILLLLAGSCNPASSPKNEKSSVIPPCDVNLSREVSTKENPVIGLHEEALRLIVGKQYKEAEEKLRRIVTTAPAFYGAYRTLGEILPRYDTGSFRFADLLLKENPENGFLNWAAGLLRVERNTNNEAVEFFKRAIDLEPGFCEAYENLADSISLAGLTGEKDLTPEDYFRDLLNRGFMGAEYGLAYLHYKQGKYGNALVICEKLCRETKTLSTGRLYKLTGTLYSIYKQDRRALEYYKCAIGAFRTAGDTQGETAVLINMGIVYHQLREYDRAFEVYQQALSLTGIIKEKGYESGILLNMGICYKEVGDYTKALASYQQALDYSGENAGSRVLLFIYNNLGQVNEFTGSHNRARDWYKKALEISRKMKNLQQEEAGILNNLGEVCKKVGDYPGALERYAQALELLNETGSGWTKAVIHNNRGEIFSHTGKYREAEEAFELSLEYRRKTEDRKGEGITMRHIGYLHYLNGSYKKALRYYGKALELTGEEGFEGAEITGEMGICFYALKNHGKALEYLQKAIQMTGELRSLLKHEKYKTGFMRNKKLLYDTVIELLYELHQKEPHKGYDHLAFEYAEKLKARALLDLMEENEIRIKEGIPPELTAEKTEINREYSVKSSRLQEELRKSGGVVDNSLVNRLAGELKNLENEYEDLQARMAAENPRYGQLIYSRPVTPLRIKQNILAPGSLLISYRITEKALFIWRISRDDLLFTRVPVEKGELEEKILYLYNLIAKPQETTYYIGPASELYELLIKPVLPAGSPIDGLIIIPDGILHYLPFEVLLPEGIDEQTPPAYLVRKHTIHYAQSATILDHLLKTRTTGSGVAGEEVLLAMGNPLFKKGKQKTALQAGKTGALFRLGDLNPLPFSGEEVEEIGKLFQRKVILTAGEALEERIKEPRFLEEFTYIHFATHSILDEETPGSSGLVLTQDRDPREDGFLQVREIFNLEIKAKLVVLSACKTRLGQYIEGEGIIGFTRAWMYAGCSSVITALWSIEDKMTARFMSGFYKKVKEGLSYRAALREIRLRMMEQEGYGSPYFWAGFVLTGTG